MSVNDPTMESQHHPDCGWLQGPFPHRPMDDREPLFCMDCLTECICDRLRKAEQRGKLIQSAVEMDTSVINQNRSYDKGYKKGREDAARDVEALRNRWNGQHDVVQLNAAVAAARGEQA